MTAKDATKATPNLKDQDLFKLGQGYVFASFTHPASPTMMYVIFRDLTEDGKVNFAMTDPIHGPWNLHDNAGTPNDYSDDRTLYDAQFDGVFLEVSKRANLLHRELNDNIAGETWGGRTTFRKSIK